MRLRIAVLLGIAGVLGAPGAARPQPATAMVASVTAGAPDSIVTGTRTTRHGRTRTTVHSTTRTSSYNHPHRRHARRAAGVTRTTHTTTRTTHVKKPTRALPAAGGGAHSTPEADSMATRQVIEQTPTNDTSTVRERTRTTTVGSAPPGTTGAPPGALVNLNTATRDELMTLPGIDGTLADRIIGGRPYELITDLQTRGILTQPEYIRVERRIEVTP